jgi:hypothetical protein
MSMSRLEVLRKCGDLRDKVARLEKNFGVVSKATGANDPPVPSIDGVRELLDRLNAAAIIRASEDVRSALLRDAGFLALMRGLQKEPTLREALIESIQRAERTAGGPEEEEMDEPTEPYDHQAFAEARERGRRLHLGREAMKMPVLVKQFIENVQAIADDLAAGGKGVSASDVAKMSEGTKQDKGPMVDYGLQKSATDRTPVDVRDLGRPRRMHQSEILR